MKKYFSIFLSTILILNIICPSVVMADDKTNLDICLISNKPIYCGYTYEKAYDYREAIRSEITGY